MACFEVTARKNPRGGASTFYFGGQLRKLSHTPGVVRRHLRGFERFGVPTRRRGMRFCISFPGIHAVGISYPVSISAGVRNVDYPRYSFGEYPGQCRGCVSVSPFPVPVVYAIRQGGIIRVTPFPGIKTPIKGALLRHRCMPLGMVYAIQVQPWAYSTPSVYNIGLIFTPLVYAIGNIYAIGHGLTA